MSINSLRGGVPGPLASTVTRFLDVQEAGDSVLASRSKPGLDSPGPFLFHPPALRATSGKGTLC